MSKRDSSMSQDTEKEQIEFEKLVEVCRMATEKLNLQSTKQDNVTTRAAHCSIPGEICSTCLLKQDGTVSSDKRVQKQKMSCRGGSSSSPSCNYNGKRYVVDHDYLNDKKGLFHHVKGKKKSRNHYVEIASLPLAFKNRIQGLKGGDVKLIIQKHLFAADTLTSQNRFSIPINQVEQDFLTEEEKLRVPMEVPLIEPNLNLTHIVIRKWNYSGKSSSYMLCGSWSAVISRNNLQVGMPMQLWSFRVDGELNFALVKVLEHNRQDDAQVYGIANTSQSNAESRDQQHAIEQIHSRNRADQDGGHILMDAAPSTYNQMEDID